MCILCFSSDYHRMDGRQDWKEEGRSHRGRIFPSGLCSDERQCEFRHGEHIAIMLCNSADGRLQFICARIIAGLGIGFVNTIIPSWVSELSSAHNRGSNFALVFVANYLGIVIAYWLNFSIRGSNVEFRWRFPLAFMAIPMLIVLFSIPLLPESPRYVPSPEESCHFF